MTTKKRKKSKLSAKAIAARSPGWLATAAASKVTSSGRQRFKDRKLGTFGPAGPVKTIDSVEYAAQHGEVDHD